MEFNQFALKNLMRSRVRTLLTVLSAMVATMTLFITLSLNNGYESAVDEELVKNVGVHLYITREGCPMEAASIIAQGGISPLYVPQEIVQELKDVEHVKDIMPFKIFAITTLDGLRTDIFLGVTDAIQRIRPTWKLTEGGWFQDENSVILGAEIARLEKRNIGDMVYFEEFDKEFKVSGILERNNTQDDGMFFLPLAAAQKLIGREGKLSAIAIQLEDVAYLEDVKIELRGMLEEDYYVFPPKDISNGVMKFFGSTKAIMFLMILIAFGSCILGIANTMLMVTQERRKELAYLKCVGAGISDIAHLIFLETFFISCVGIALGLAMSFLLIPQFEQFIRHYLVVYIPASNVVRPSLFLGVLTSIIVFFAGMLAAFYPIAKSAKITPMEALRNE